MDSIKEIFEAMGQRIRSPFWGYVFLSFVFLNWKPLYYLMFSESTVPVKFRFFDLNTDWWSLYALPLFFGFLATLFAPYISEYAARWAEKPVNRKRLREVGAAHLVLQSKNRLAAERENERTIFEQSLIDQAKRDEQIETISDPEVRQQVAEKIEDSRYGAGSVLRRLAGASAGGMRDSITEGIPVARQFENFQSLAENYRQMGHHEKAAEMLEKARLLIEKQQ